MRVVSFTAAALAITIAIAAVVAPVAAPAAEDDAAAQARAGLARIQALRIERPRDGALAYYEALLHAQLGERDAALAVLRMLSGRHLGIVPVESIGFGALWADADFQKLRRQLEAEEPKTPTAPVRWRLHDPKLIPEGIAHDAAGKRFFIGSIAQHKIVAFDAAGRERPFSKPDDKLDSVLGLAVDARRRQLLAVSTNGLDDSAKAERRNAVIRYDLARGTLVARHAAPDASQLNDVAVAAGAAALDPADAPPPDGAELQATSAASAIHDNERPAPMRMNIS